MSLKWLFILILQLFLNLFYELPWTWHVASFRQGLDKQAFVSDVVFIKK